MFGMITEVYLYYCNLCQMTNISPKSAELATISKKEVVISNDQQSKFF